jgi:hypothetical protein
MMHFSIADVAGTNHMFLGWLGTARREQLSIRLSPARPGSNQKTGLFAVNAAFCRLVFVQLPLFQTDMAEACGSRKQFRLEFQELRRIGEER